MRVEVNATVKVAITFHALASATKEQIETRALYILAQRLPEGVVIQLDVHRPSVTNAT